MLVLTRRLGEQILIGDGLIQLKILKIEWGKIRIGILAPSNIAIDREEIFLQKLEEERADDRRITL